MTPAETKLLDTLLDMAVRNGFKKGAEMTLNLLVSATERGASLGDALQSTRRSLLKMGLDKECV